MTVPVLIDRKMKRVSLYNNFLYFVMKKILIFSVLLLLIVFLSGCSLKQPNQASEVQNQLPSIANQQESTRKNSSNQVVETAPSTVSYSNEKYGLKITFPSEINGFEPIETSLKNYRAYNPLFDIEFGKNKEDFFEADGQRHGNMLSVWIFDKKRCDDLKLDENEKRFCDETKNVTDIGLWKGYEQGATTKGLWFGNENYIYYLFDPSFAEEKGLLGKIKVELLKTKQVQ